MPVRLAGSPPWSAAALLLVASLATWAPAAPPDPRPAEKLSLLAGAEVQVGVDLNAGGAITWLSRADDDTNLVNSWDWGRQIQMSHYSGPVPYAVGDKQPADVWRHLGWNPVQAGDHFGHASTTLEHRNDGREVYVRCRPQQWPLDNAPADCLFETWLRLDGPAVLVRCRLTNQRTDTTRYAARQQELPAVYTNGPYYRLLTYRGDRPFTGGPLERITYTPTPEQPWTTWNATERWAALVDDDDFGVGVYSPLCVRFGGGFSGRPGAGGPHDIATGYVSPQRPETLDHNIVYDYEYALIVGKLDTIRGYVYRHADRRPPAWRFERERQGWWTENCRDGGWPLADHWSLELTGDDPQLIGPLAFWRADDAPTLWLEAAFQVAEPTATLYFATHAEPGFSETRRVTFPLRADGQFHRYAVDLASSPAYRGGVVGVRLDPTPRGGAGQWARIRSVSLRPPLD